MSVLSIGERVTEQMRTTRRSLPAPDTCRHLRESAGLTRAQLAAILNVTPQSIRNWETGERVPRGRQLAAYLEALSAMRAA